MVDVTFCLQTSIIKVLPLYEGATLADLNFYLGALD